MLKSCCSISVFLSVQASNMIEEARACVEQREKLAEEEAKRKELEEEERSKNQEKEKARLEARKQRQLQRDSPRKAQRKVTSGERKKTLQPGQSYSDVSGKRKESRSRDPSPVLSPGSRRKSSLGRQKSQDHSPGRRTSRQLNDGASSGVPAP